MSSLIPNGVQLPEREEIRTVLTFCKNLQVHETTTSASDEITGIHTNINHWNELLWFPYGLSFRVQLLRLEELFHYYATQRTPNKLSVETCTNMWVSAHAPGTSDVNLSINDELARWFPNSLRTHTRLFGWHIYIFYNKNAVF